MFESLFNTLAAMQREGYTVELPASVDALRERIIDGNAQRFGAAANVHARIAADDHVRREKHLKEIEAQWGPAPGRQQSDGAASSCSASASATSSSACSRPSATKATRCACCSRRASRRRMPSRPSTAGCARTSAPHAVLHFGTHGALEFMPGKQNGLSAACWPDRLIGDLPNFYLYASNNPSEGTIAKRRAAATLISYLTPPVAQAGLYKGLVDLKALLERYRGLEPDATIEARRARVDDPGAGRRARPRRRPSRPWGDDARHARSRSSNDAVLELEYTLIPHGLHVVGQAPTRARARRPAAVAGRGVARRAAGARR